MTITEWFEALPGGVGEWQGVPGCATTTQELACLFSSLPSIKEVGR